MRAAPARRGEDECEIPDSGEQRSRDALITVTVVNDNELTRRFGQLTQMLGELDRKVAFLFRQLNLQFVDERPPLDEIEKMVADGDRLTAVKLYALKHKLALADAKRAVEEIAARLGV